MKYVNVNLFLIEQVMETTTEVSTIKATINNPGSLQIINLSTNRERSENEDSDSLINTTTMKMQSNSELKDEDFEMNIKVPKNTTSRNENSSKEYQESKNVEYNTTEVESSLSDEIVMVLEEKTGWVCNGTVCTDLGPIYDRQKSSEGNKPIAV